MSVFEKNGMLSSMEQVEVKRRENAILAGPGDDNHKVTLIQNLYRERGLEVGSFYRADFDQTNSSGDLSSYSSADSDGGGTSGKLILLMVLILVFVIAGPTYFPKTEQAIFHIIYVILSSVGDAIMFLVNKL